MSVVAVDIDATGLNQLQQEYSSMIIPVIMDVSDETSIVSLFEDLDRKSIVCYGLINNAGIYYGRSVFDYTFDDIQKVLNVNVVSHVLFSKCFAEQCIKTKERGVIINITSVSGQEGSSDAVYGASKAAIIGLTKSCAMNFSPYVRVNAIAPGIVLTPMMKNIPQERIEQYRTHEYIGDPIEPHDIASTVMFLLGDGGKHYTGAVFDINNGCYMR